MKKIQVDDTKCMACLSCEIACCVAHSGSENLYGAASEDISSRVKVGSGKKGRGFPLMCRQCPKPPCGRVCEANALYLNEEGVVMLDENLCTDCLKCIEGCPRGAIYRVSKANTYSVIKCDLCVDSGYDPACVKACMTNALSLKG